MNERGPLARGLAIPEPQPNASKATLFCVCRSAFKGRMRYAGDQ
jgi:hypothetical protein